MELAKPKHGWRQDEALSALRARSIAVVVVAVGLGMGLVLAWEKFGAATVPTASTPAQPVPSGASDEMQKLRSVDAKAGFETELTQLKELAGREQVDAKKYLESVDKAAAAAGEAIAVSDFAAAERHFNLARTELKTARKHLIDERVAALASAAEQAITQGKLEAANGFVARAKSLRELKQSP